VNVLDESTTEKKQAPVEAVIRLHAYDPFIITTREYEKLLGELQARTLAGDLTLGDRIVARLLHEHASRYFEAKEQNQARGIIPSENG
jgi:hypothetical protein